MATILKRPARVIEYPESDGKPMAETDIHRKVMIDVIERLSARYASRNDVYVSGNLLVYFEEGNPKRCLAPDCFAVFGVPAGDRRVFKTWEEGKCPEVVFEITSKKTKREDMETKFDIYADVWQVKELFFFDPTEDYLKPSLTGFRRIRGELKPIKLLGGRLASRELGITLERSGTRLLLRDELSGHELPLPHQAELEAENAKLRQEIERLKKK